MGPGSFVAGSSAYLDSARSIVPTKFEIELCNIGELWMRYNYPTGSSLSLQSSNAMKVNGTMELSRRQTILL